MENQEYNEEEILQEEYQEEHHQEEQAMIRWLKENYPIPAPPKTRWWKRLACLVLVAGLIAAGSAVTAVYMEKHWSDDIKRSEQLIAGLEQTIEDLKQEIKDNSFTGNGNSVSGSPNVSLSGLTPGQVYAQNYKSVVAVSGKSAEGSSTGSGFILSADGYVVSNHHVIEGATSWQVTTYDGTQYKAAVVGYDASNDLAVLKIDGKDLQAVKLGSSHDIIVGDQVVAIGNPLGTLHSTLTVGYISATEREINTGGALINMLQTDAAINPGNSGGPLFNMKGEVVGITTAKYSGTTSSGASIEGIGFAIPLDDVLKKITDLQQFGYFTGAVLGVMVHDMNRADAEYYDLPLGAYVTEVTEGSCAAAAGVQEKDIIIAVGGKTVTGINELSRVLDEFQKGDKTSITVWRGGREVDLPVILDGRGGNQAG